MLSGDCVQYAQIGSCVCEFGKQIKGLIWRLVAVKGEDSRELKKAWCLSGREYLRERQTSPDCRENKPRVAWVAGKATRQSWPLTTEVGRLAPQGGRQRSCRDSW